MKKITFLLIIGFLSLIGNKVSAASYGNGDLKTILTNCTDGEVIVLTGTAYTFSAKISGFTKGFTLIADPSLTTRPVVSPLPAGVMIIFAVSAEKTVTFDGIDFDGNAACTGLITGAVASTSGNLKINVNNCVIRNLASTAIIFAYTAITGFTVYDDLIVTNSSFIGPLKSMLVANTATVGPNNLLFKNCLIKGTGTTTNNIALSMGVTTTTGFTSATLDHCTFEAHTGNKQTVSIKSGIPTTVKNCIFSNSANSTVNVFGTLNTGQSLKNGAFGANAGTLSTTYPLGSGLFITTTPALNAITFFAEASGYLGAGTDGKNIGYYNASNINKSSSFSSFSYSEGAGPSGYQSFTVSGTDVFNNITISSASSNYEFCLTTGGTYTTNLTLSPTLGQVASTTVYTRLKSGLSAAAYNEAINITSTNATSQTIACSGTVTSGGSPTITTSVSILTGFNYIYAQGPSTQQSFTVSGSNLSANVAIAAPTNYEVSLSSGTGFGASASIPFGSGTLTAVPVYVRLKAGLSGGSYNTENIALTSTGATEQGVACSGTVTPATITLTPGSLSSFFVLAGSATPSAEKTFTVSATNVAGNLTVTPPTNYEISTASGLSFAATNPITILQANAGTPTIIYVRLKGALATATYNEDITVATAGASNSILACSGVVATPVIKVGNSAGLDNKVSLGAQTYVYGFGPSSSIGGMFVSGDYLQSDVTATAATGFEVSKDNSTFADFVTFTMSNQTVSGQLYNRLKAGFNADSYTGNIVLSSTGSPNRTIGVTGSVTGGPKLTAGTLTGLASYLNYAGNGPSAVRAFLLTGTDLASDVTVTPSTNFEVSLVRASGYSSSAITSLQADAAAGDSIYIRLKAGLAPNTYNEAITIAATNANTRTVSVSGTVTSLITTSASSIIGVTYAGNGPSVERTIDISGSNLTGDITLTPPANFEISLTTVSGFTLSPIVLTRSGSVVNNTTIYVRMKAGLAIGSYTGENIVCTSASATTKNIGCSGTVTALPAITSFTPTTATNGASVVITGYNFTGATAVSFGGTAATSYIVDSGTQITAVVAAGATGSVSVTTGIGTGTLAGFTYTNNQTIATTATASALTLTPASNVTVANGGTLTINQATSINSITIERGGRVTNTNSLTVPTFTINSDANGTGTYVDNGTTTVTGTTTVNQYVTSTATGVAGRNWYISSPVSAALSSTITNATGNGLVYYAGGSSWLDAGTTMEVMKGYIAKSPAQITTIAFSGGTLNTGPQSVSDLPLGFNLVGNPYPSYLNWTDATKTNVSTSIWYRSKSTGSYLFQTYNVAGEGTSVNGGTELIPPMQSFWIKTTSSTNTLGFTNNMRSHQDQSIATNRLKSPKVSTQQLLRLQVSNGTNRDEAVVYFNEKAQNTLDTFDSQKMFNNITEVPEIYTQIGADKLVINGMRAIPYDIEMPVGFNTLQSNNFSISATELKNFDADTKIILKDNLLKIEKDITNGQSYEFSSEVANSTSRFSIQFKSASQANGNNNPADDFSNITIYRNENNLITINCSSAIVANGIITVCNSVGQKMINSRITSTNSVINTPLESGVYFVTVSAAGNTTTKKVFIN